MRRHMKRCYCGREFYAPLSSGRVFCSTECRRAVPHNTTTHGMSGTRLHAIWCHMKSRCLCPTSRAYSDYGGRGISICDEWSNDFMVFYNWATANGYREDLEIDRINVNGNYEPDNCRWANRIQQMHNTRKRRNARTSKFKGVSKHSQNNRWMAQVHSSGKTLNLGSFKTQIEAALAYDDYAFETRGEYAHLNFPERKKVIQAQARDGKARIGIDAAKEVKIDRDEIYQRKLKESGA